MYPSRFLLSNINLSLYCQSASPSAEIARTPDQLQPSTEPSQDELSARAFSTCYKSSLVPSTRTPPTSANRVPSSMLPSATTPSALVPSALVS